MEYLIKDVIKIIEDFAPLSLQSSYDNCGLKCGDVNNKLTGVLITLDTNEVIVNEAISLGCNLIIEHHPSIFKSIKSIEINKSTNRALINAAYNEICIYSAHTNIDFTKDGLNDYVCEIMALKNIHKIDTDDSPRIGVLNEDKSLKDYIGILKLLFNDKNCYSVGRLDKNIHTVAVVNGGGGGSEEDMIKSFNNGADVFVSGDFKYNVLRLAKDNDYAIICIGHYNMEIYFIDLIYKILTNKIDFKRIFKTSKLLNPCN